MLTGTSDQAIPALNRATRPLAQARGHTLNRLAALEAHCRQTPPVCQIATLARAVTRPAHLMAGWPRGDRLIALFAPNHHPLGRRSLMGTILRAESPIVVRGRNEPLATRWACSSDLSAFDPTLADLVQHVASVGRQKEVVRTTARGVIAVMANMQPRGNWASCKHPRQAARATRHIFDREATVAFLVPSAQPGPARVGCGGGSINFRPEALLHSSVDAGHRHVRDSTAQSRSQCCGNRWWDSGRFAQLAADLGLAAYE